MVNDVRQTEIQAAKPLVPELGAFELEMAIKKQKSHKSPGIIQIPPEIVNLLFLFGIRRNCLRSGRSRSLYLSIRRAIKQIVEILGANYVQTFIQNPAVKVNSTCRGNYLGSSLWILMQQVNG
jgi:hypothetical protein